MKHRAIAIAGMITGLLLPFTASALTMEDIQSQIAALLQQITELQAQILTLNNASSTVAVPSDASVTQPATPSTTAPLSCITLGSAFGPGARGDDVLRLQQFLISKGYLSSDSGTGFYGSLTVAAVQKLQQEQGIAASGDPSTTGFGAIGPKTRAALACKTGAGNSCKYITQTQPTTVCAAGWQKSVDASGCQQGWFCPAVETTPTQNACTFLPPPTTGCDGGAWTANLDYKSCVTGWSCKSVTVNTSACPALTPIVCTSGTVQTTGYDSKGCALGYRCSNTAIVTPSISCPVYSLLMCDSGYHRGPSTTASNGCTVPGVCVRDGVTEAPVVTGVDGPVSLNVGQTGTWTVHASVPNQPGAQIRYSVVWGDEPVYSLLQNMVAQSSSIPTASTFTHAYANAATYSPKFTVSNDAGSAQTSTTVSVGQKSVPNPNCPVYMQSMPTLIACPAGQHWVAGTPAYDSNGCLIPGKGSCVPDSNSIFSASPTSGAAPLTVTFTTNQELANGQYVADAGSYKVLFGDGGEYVFPCTGSSPGCSGPHATTHTYKTSGTYTASLVHFGYFGISLDGSAPTNVVGTVSITVGGSSGASSINLSAPAAGTSVAIGNSLGISWTSQSAPADSEVRLALLNTKGQYVSNGIADKLPASGTYQWTVPFSVINTDIGMMLQPGTYQIKALLLAKDACVVMHPGGGCWPGTFQRDPYAETSSGMFTITSQTSLPTSVPTSVQNIKSTDDFVRYLYRCVLGREGEQSGVSERVSRLQSGAVGIQGIYQELFLGAEYQSRNRDNTQYVNDIYNCALFRTGEVSGVTTWVQTLNSQSRAMVLNYILSGAEFGQSVMPVLNTVIHQWTVLSLSNGGQTSNLANVLTALESALKKFLGQ